MDLPTFGCVLFGSLDDFAKGAPHFSVVSSLRWNNRWCFRLAPVSSKAYNRNNPLVLWLPATTEFEPGRTYLRCGSYVLLHWRTCYDKMDIDRLARRGRLPDDLQKQAQAILNQLPAWKAQ